MTEPVAGAGPSADLAWLAEDDLAWLPAHRETRSDTGNAWRLARLHAGTLRYLAAEKTWLVWDGQRLRRDELNHAFHLTLDVCADVRQARLTAPEDERPAWARWAEATESVARREAMLKAAAALPVLRLAPEDLDAPKHLLNTTSGTLDLRDGSVHGHRVEDRLSHVCGTGYDPELRWTPLLAEYQATFCPDPAEWAYVLRLLGSTLLAGNPLRIWLVMHGPSTTGKTQLTEAVAAALGDYAVPVNTSVFRANQDDKPRPDLLRALSARLVYAMEGSQAWELHGDHVKRLTGEDPLVARAMRANTMVARVPDFTPLIVCNSYPRLRGNADEAVRRRLRVLPFTNSVLGWEDPGKRAAFAADEDTRAALLGQLVDGCREAFSGGLSWLDATEPARFAAARFEAFGELNNVTDFLNFMTASGALVRAEDQDHFLTQCWGVGDLYGRYSSWLAAYGSAEDRRGQLGLRQFNAELRAYGWEMARSGEWRWAGVLRVDPTR